MSFIFIQIVTCMYTLAESESERKRERESEINDRGTDERKRDAHTHIPTEREDIMTCKLFYMRWHIKEKVRDIRKEPKRNNCTKSTSERNEEFLLFDGRTLAQYGSMRRICHFYFIVCFSNFHLLRILMQTKRNETKTQSRETRRNKMKEEKKTSSEQLVQQHVHTIYGVCIHKDMLPCCDCICVNISIDRVRYCTHHHIHRGI